MSKTSYKHILQQGVVFWNQWKKEHAKVSPDFNYEDLSHLDLSEVNFSQMSLYKSNFSHTRFYKANLSRSLLSGADLRGTDLQQAYLIGADLSAASLKGANLSGAKLQSANLSRADLSNANLSGADLYETNLSGANLQGTDFQAATASFTVFAQSDLRAAKGLEQMIHLYPSHLSVDALLHSCGDLPLPFLRGIGFPDELILWSQQLKTKPVNMHTCFIYSAEQDQEFAQRLQEDLQKLGIRCWLGRGQHPNMPHILLSKHILVFSRHSVDLPGMYSIISDGCEQEQEQGQIFLFPILLDRAFASSQFDECVDLAQTHRMVDFSDCGDEQAYQNALRQISDEIVQEITVNKN